MLGTDCGARQARQDQPTTAMVRLTPDISHLSNRRNCANMFERFELCERPTRANCSTHEVAPRRTPTP